MIRSPYATKLTRMIQDGEKNPERDMTNYKALQRGERYFRWLERQKKAA